MMLPTHALGGMALALPLLTVAPEFAGIGLVAGLFGGIFPDLDMYVGHRKTLHYPVYYSVLAIGMALVAAFVPTAIGIGIAFFLLGASIHSVSDILGGGLELRPWESTSNRAVYDHHNSKWIAPRRWIRYDGSPEDLLLSVTIAALLLVSIKGVFNWLILSTLTVAAGYTALRRILPDVAVLLVQILPTPLLAHVPARYLSDPSDRSTAR